MKVVVIYEDGKVRSFDVDAPGGGDLGEIVAAQNIVWLSPRNGLLYAPRVLPWRDGKWREPSGIKTEWTLSSPETIKGLDKLPFDASMRSEHHTEKESYLSTGYQLLNNNGLKGAVSITVDGVITHAREGDVLVSVTGIGSISGGGEMVEEYGTDHRPAAPSTANSMTHASTNQVQSAERSL